MILTITLRFLRLYLSSMRFVKNLQGGGTDCKVLRAIGRKGKE